MDQWIENQNDYAKIYSLTAAGGLAWAFLPPNRELWDLWVADDNTRVEIYSLGIDAFQISGALSLFHSFRSAAKSHQAQGEYMFLQEDETPKQLMLAPLQFSNLKNWTSFLPLGLAATLMGVVIAQNSHSDIYASDVFFSTAHSYTAGTSEEMVFRGWLLPMFYEKFDNFFLANLSSSLLFAAAHLPSVKIPWPQFLLGFHFAYTSHLRNWTLSESIFIHTWWDVCVFIALSAASSAGRYHGPTPRIPLVQAVF
jgi:membrane protease YdiL (CAAX protease family)